VSICENHTIMCTDYIDSAFSLNASAFGMTNTNMAIRVIGL